MNYEDKFVYIDYESTIYKYKIKIKRLNYIIK